MSEYKNIRVRNFYSQVLDWEQEFAPGSETSMYGDCARELSRIDNMSVNSPDDDEEYDNKLDDEIDRVIEWWTDYYEYLGEERDAIEDDVITAEEVSKLWDGDAESSMQRIRDLISEREAADNA